MLYLVAHSFLNGQSNNSNFFPLPELHETQFKNNRGALGTRMMVMMMMNFIHVSMYLADANWGHNIKIK